MIEIAPGSKFLLYIDGVAYDDGTTRPLLVAPAYLSWVTEVTEGEGELGELDPKSLEPTCLFTAGSGGQTGRIGCSAMVDQIPVEAWTDPIRVVAGARPPRPVALVLRMGMIVPPPG